MLFTSQLSHSTKLLRPQPLDDLESAVIKSTRESKGTHPFPTVKKLMQSKENWYPIQRPEDYHFRGVFSHDHPKQIGYYEDITIIPNYVATDPDFMYKDIQIGKGKAQGNQTIELDVAGRKERMMYKIVPCNGVKVCPAEGCDHMVPTWEIKPCPQHKGQPLTRSAGCPVEFIYIQPEEEADNRW